MNNGVLIIDKPIGYTSHDIVSIVKRSIGARKVGHLGTLDPDATGVLPLVINQATKYAQVLAGKEKIYEFDLCLGIATDTDDHAGKILSSKPVPDDAHERLLDRLPSYIGCIKQVPPIFSAKKIKGKRSYQLARSGDVVQLDPVDVVIDDLQVLVCKGSHYRMRLSCQTGTYVRSICRDLGADLMCGAHAANIRRLKSGHFSLDQACTLEVIKSAPEQAVEYMIALNKLTNI